MSCSKKHEDLSLYEKEMRQQWLDKIQFDPRSLPLSEYPAVNAEDLLVKQLRGEKHNTRVPTPLKKQERLFPVLKCSTRPASHQQKRKMVSPRPVQVQTDLSTKTLFHSQQPHPPPMLDSMIQAQNDLAVRCRDRELQLESLLSWCESQLEERDREHQHQIVAIRAKHAEELQRIKDRCESLEKDQKLLPFLATCGVGRASSPDLQSRTPHSLRPPSDCRHKPTPRQPTQAVACQTNTTAVRVTEEDRQAMNHLFSDTCEKEELKGALFSLFNQERDIKTLITKHATLQEGMRHSQEARALLRFGVVPTAPTRHVRQEFKRFRKK